MERTLEGGDLSPVRREPASGVKVSRAVKRVESQVTEREEPARIPVECQSEVSS
jgi:hypothetical protein